MAPHSLTDAERPWPSVARVLRSLGVGAAVASALLVGMWVWEDPRFFARDYYAADYLADFDWLFALYLTAIFAAVLFVAFAVVYGIVRLLLRP